MKKQYMLMIVLATGIIAARAQSSFTTIQYNKKMRPALVLELPNNDKGCRRNYITKAEADRI